MLLKIYTSLREDVNQGWVWIGKPDLPERCVVKISNISNGEKVYCETLKIDDNFLNHYNCRENTLKINDKSKSIVINYWYRAKLGNIPQNEFVDLEITPYYGCCICKCYANIMACIQHPQIIVRMAIWLGIISVALGIIGVGISLL